MTSGYFTVLQIYEAHIYPKIRQTGTNTKRTRSTNHRGKGKKTTPNKTHTQTCGMLRSNNSVTINHIPRLTLSNKPQEKNQPAIPCMEHKKRGARSDHTHTHTHTGTNKQTKNEREAHAFIDSEDDDEDYLLSVEPTPVKSP